MRSKFFDRTQSRKNVHLGWRWKRRAVVVAVSFLGLLAGLEVGFRIYFRDDYGFPNYRNWHFQRVWRETYANLNSLGHRDHEFSVGKPPGTFRILTLGDAHTYGEGVESIDDLYTEILERKLNANSASLTFEVLNVSEEVWEIEHYISALKDPGLSYEPDLVLLGLYINDVEDRRIPRPYPEKGRITRLVPDAVRQVLIRTSFLYFHTVGTHEKQRAKDHWVSYVRSFVRPDSSHWERFVPMFEDFLKVCEAEDIPVVVAIFPWLVEWHEGHPFAEYYENVAQVAVTNGVSSLKMFDHLKNYEISSLRAGVNRWRSGELVHELAAEAIYQHLQDQHLLPVAPEESP